MEQIGSKLHHAVTQVCSKIVGLSKSVTVLSTVSIVTVAMLFSLACLLENVPLHFGSGEGDIVKETQERMSSQILSKAAGACLLAETGDIPCKPSLAMDVWFLTKFCASRGIILISGDPSMKNCWIISGPHTLHQS